MFSGSLNATPRCRKLCEADDRLIECGQPCTIMSLSVVKALATCLRIKQDIVIVDTAVHCLIFSGATYKQYLLPSRASYLSLHSWLDGLQVLTVQQFNPVSDAEL